MSGMNCGTVSSIAWPILQAGVDISTSVSDTEVHAAVQCLQSIAISAGPCGAAPLAALRSIAQSPAGKTLLDQESVVVLLCTEGNREYKPPMEAHDANTRSIA